MYAVPLTCINPIQDIKQTLLPPLEDLARAAAIQLEAVVTGGTQHIKELEAALRASETREE